MCVCVCVHVCVCGSVMCGVPVLWFVCLVVEREGV